MKVTPGRNATRRGADRQPQPPAGESARLRYMAVRSAPRTIAFQFQRAGAIFFPPGWPKPTPCSRRRSGATDVVSDREAARCSAPRGFQRGATRRKKFARRSAPR
jgi:hypothetical protein